MSKIVKEQWRPITYRGVNYEGIYEISNLGRLISFISGQPKEIAKNKKRRRFISLHKDGKKQEATVARLIVSTFKREIKKGEVVDHINRIPYDDRLCNLQILTYSQHQSKDHWAKQWRAKGWIPKCEQK